MLTNTPILNPLIRLKEALYFIATEKRYFWYICLAAIITAITSYTNFGHNTGDEYSQIFEFAGYKMGYIDQGDLRIEFGSQMRPTIQVWMVVAVFRFIGLFTSQVNPFLVTYLVYLTSGLFGIFSILVFTKAFMVRVKPQYREWFVVISLFSWLVLYTNPHFNSESICGHLLLLAVGLLFAKLENLSVVRIIVSGLLLGLSFSCRFQIGFAILGLMLWLLYPAYKAKKLSQWWLLASSMVIAILVFNFTSDFYFYGKWVCSAYNYYHQNIALGIMDSWSGVSPWYAYLFMVSMYLPFGPLYVLATIYYFIKYPLDVLTSIIGLFLLFHVLIGHKEVRFLMPMLGFLPLILMVVTADLVERFDWLALHLKKIATIIWIMNLLACMSLLIPAATEIGGWRYLYNYYRKPTLVYFNVSVNQKLLFYKKKNVNLVKYKSGEPTPCPPGYNVLIAMNANSNDAKPNHPLVYTFFPFNLSNILPKAIVHAVGHFDLYEVKNIEAD